MMKSYGLPHERSTGAWRARLFRVFPVTWMLSLALAFGLPMTAPPVVQAATHTVTIPDNAGTGSLRQMVAVADAGDVIEISATTITLTAPILLDKNLTIRGISGNRTTVVIFGDNAT